MAKLLNQEQMMELIQRQIKTPQPRMNSPGIQFIEIMILHIEKDKQKSRIIFLN